MSPHTWSFHASKPLTEADRSFTLIYQSNGRALPFVRDRLVGPLSKVWLVTCVLVTMVSQLVGGPLRTLGLQDDASWH